MTPQIKWIDIPFSFDIPAGRYPALVERLSGTPARLEEKIQDIPFLILTSPFENGWSIQQHVGHLADLEELLTVRLDDFEMSRDTLSAADMNNKKTEDANHSDNDINTLLKNFRNARASNLKKLLEYDVNIMQHKALHPRLLKQMSITDLVYFFAEHDDHHLATIRKIAKDLS